MGKVGEGGRVPAEGKGREGGRGVLVRREGPTFAEKVKKLPL